MKQFQKGTVKTNVLITSIMLILFCAAYFYLNGKQEVNKNYLPVPNMTSATSSSSVSSTTESGIDCTDNVGCFIQAANNCQPATAILSQQNLLYSPINNNLGIVNSQTISYQVLGKSGNMCSVQLQYLNYVFTFDATETQYLLVHDGGTQANINNIEKEIEQEAMTGYTECSLNLNEKIGNALEQDLMNPTSTTSVQMNETSGVITFSDSGLSCRDESSSQATSTLI